MNEIRKQLGPMADSYTRDVLDLKTLELCTVAALTVQGFSLPELKLHIDAALRSGASREEVIEVITQMMAYRLRSSSERTAHRERSALGRAV
jgi:alkylhydroperoxidase/carboxymuconolactone decarboxylase family protein YurZ